MLVLSATLDHENLLRAVRTGADGVLDKLAGLDQIVEETRGVLAGRALPSQRGVAELLHLPSDYREIDGVEPAETRLDPIELEALRALARGLDDEGVADALDVSPNEARALLDGAARKLGARSRLHALLLAANRGLVEIDV